MTFGFRIEALGPLHDRKDFTSGSAPLDRYFREYVTQDIKRRVTNCFVATGPAGVIAGYYTFAASGLPLAELTGEEGKRLPRYGLLPGALIGRLAVDSRFRKQGLGSSMVLDAAARAARSEPAVFALLVEAKDDAAIAFYQHIGFRRFASKADTLYLPVATALRAMPV